MTTVLTLLTEAAGRHAKAWGATCVAPAPIIILAAGGIADTFLAATGTTRTAARSSMETRSIAYPVNSIGNTITIVAFTPTLDTGKAISFSADSVSGLTGSMRYALFWTTSMLSYAPIAMMSLMSARRVRAY